MKSNKQLKDEYKQQKQRMGVYQIRNKVNGKILIGSSLNLDAIWNRIQSELRFIGHRNVALQHDWNTFGADQFEFEVLAEIKERPEEKPNYGNELKELQAMYTDELKPFGDKGYNSSTS